MFYSVIKIIMKETTTRKFILTDWNTCEELVSGFHPSQLEEKFGGEAENVYEYWPPSFPSKVIGYDESLIVSKKEYLTILEDRPHLIKSKEAIEEMKYWE